VLYARVFQPTNIFIFITIIITSSSSFFSESRVEWPVSVSITTTTECGKVETENDSTTSSFFLFFFLGSSNSSSSTSKCYSTTSTRVSTYNEYRYYHSCSIFKCHWYGNKTRSSSSFYIGSTNKKRGYDVFITY